MLISYCQHASYIFILSTFGCSEALNFVYLADLIQCGEDFDKHTD